MKTPKTLKDLGEFGLIDWIKKNAPSSSSVIKGIGDDTAVLDYSKDKYLLLTTDMLVEGVHFTRSMDAKLIGRKALACSVSDIGAMGGSPKHAVISLGVSPKTSTVFIQNIYKGLNVLARKYHVDVVGGDTVKSERMVINVTLTGEVNKKHLTLRSGAKVGDWIFVTGPLGRSFQSGHHLTFTPRIKEALFLVNHIRPTSMMDISDGLSADLGHIIQSSGVGALIDSERIPRRKGASVEQALHDGEDFELLLTVPQRKAAGLKKFFPIGEITNTHGKIYLRSEKNLKLISPKGYVHF